MPLYDISGQLNIDAQQPLFVIYIPNPYLAKHDFYMNIQPLSVEGLGRALIMPYNFRGETVYVGMIRYELA